MTNPHAEGDMKPSERDLEKAKAIYFRFNSEIPTHWHDSAPEQAVKEDIESIAQALAKERASLPESVVLAMSKYSMFSGNQEMRKALSELKAWQRGEL